MKLTIIAGYFDPEQTADVHLNHDLVYGLAKSGIDVTLITPYPNRGLTVDQQNEYKDKTDVRGDCFRIIRVGKPSFYKKGLFLRGIYFIKKTIELYLVAKKIESDIYLIISTPPFLGYIACLLADRKPVVYKLQDVFPDSLTYAKNISYRNPLIKILQIFEKFVYKRCQHIIAVSDDINNNIRKKGVLDKKISVVYDWIDYNTCIPIERNNNPLFDEYNLKRYDFYVCYAGNIGPLQSVDTIIEVAKLIETDYPQIQFLIVGNGSCENIIHSYIKNMNLHNIICIPMQPAEKISYVYSLGDIDLVTLKKGITKCALPSKTWSILSAGRAMVATIDNGCALYDIIEDNEIGICVEPENPQALSNAIIELYKNREKLTKMGEKGRKYVINNFCVEKALDKYTLILQQVVNKNV